MQIEEESLRNVINQINSLDNTNYKLWLTTPSKYNPGVRPKVTITLNDEEIPLNTINLNNTNITTPLDTRYTKYAKINEYTTKTTNNIRLFLTKSIIKRTDAKYITTDMIYTLVQAELLSYLDNSFHKLHLTTVLNLIKYNSDDKTNKLLGLEYRLDTEPNNLKLYLAKCNIEVDIDLKNQIIKTKNTIKTIPDESIRYQAYQDLNTLIVQILPSSLVAQQY